MFYGNKLIIYMYIQSLDLHGRRRGTSPDCIEALDWGGSSPNSSLPVWTFNVRARQTLHLGNRRRMHGREHI